MNQYLSVSRTRTTKKPTQMFLKRKEKKKKKKKKTQAKRAASLHPHSAKETDSQTRAGYLAPRARPPAAECP